jgi:Zn-dependent protease
MDIQPILQQIAILVPPFLLAITFHELAHGYIAWKLGDPTAKSVGRLTMNPIKHIDPLGLIALFIMSIGWAKPVPVDPRYFKNPKKDMLFVAIAGPAANLLLAVASAILFKFLIAAPVVPMFFMEPLLKMLLTSVWINIMLAVFNCLPIPPLDGSKILMSLLPADMARSYARLEPFGFIIILALFFLGIISQIIMPIIMFINNILLG